MNSARFGELRVGRDYTPFYVTWVSIDPFSVGLVGGGLNYAIGNIARYDNAVSYDSPKFFGIQLSGAYRLGESTTDNVAAGAVEDGGNAGSLALTYAAGPARAHFLGGVYDFRIVKLHALVFRNKNDANTANRRSYALGVTVPFGAWTLLGSVARIDNRIDNGVGNDNPKNHDSMFYGVGLTYAFSRRTDAYTAAAKQGNRSNALFTIQDATTSGPLTTVGATPGSRGTSRRASTRGRSRSASATASDRRP